MENAFKGTRQLSFTRRQVFMCSVCSYIQCKPRPGMEGQSKGVQGGRRIMVIPLQVTGAARPNQIASDTVNEFLEIEVNRYLLAEKPIELACEKGSCHGTVRSVAVVADELPPRMVVQVWMRPLQGESVLPREGFKPLVVEVYGKIVPRETAQAVEQVGLYRYTYTWVGLVQNRGAHFSVIWSDERVGGMVEYDDLKREGSLAQVTWEDVRSQDTSTVAIIYERSDGPVKTKESVV